MPMNVLVLTELSAALTIGLAVSKKPCTTTDLGNDSSQAELQLTLTLSCVVVKSQSVHNGLPKLDLATMLPSTAFLCDHAE
jgi:hypothetical protein